MIYFINLNEWTSFYFFYQKNIVALNEPEIYFFL